MFKLTKKDKRTELEKEIARMEITLAATDPTSENYAKIADGLEKLYRIHENLNKGIGVDPNTLLVVAGNLMGILLILKYEKLDVITSKALGFVLKGRV